jgi:N-acetylneuraminic acid mutarotase
MTYDPVSRRIILFGGTDATGDRDDLWAYDPGTDVWTELKPSGPLPAARAGHSMVYEPTMKRMLVFGGLSSKTNSGLNDLWAYDPAVNTWTRINPPGDTPAARTMAGMVYSPDSRQVLLFGGLALSATTNGEFNDFWAYDPGVGKWTEIKPSGIIPASRQAHAMVAAPSLGGLLMYGGRNAQTDLDETWLYDLMAASWTRLEPLGGTPGARDGHTMVYDATAGAVILFGGYDPASALELGDTWVFGPASEESAL